MTDENDDNRDDDGAASEPEPKTNQLARRNMMGDLALSMDNSATQALIATARANVEARWVMAMRNPRDMDDVRQRVLAECRRPGFAEVATYARPVGKKQIDGKWVEQFAEGLSIRFAEVAARCMGNLAPDVQTIFDSQSERIVRVTVTDFESNLTWSRDITIKKTIERRNLKKGQRALGERTNSYGDRVFIVEATDDETAVKEAALISKTARTLILRVVPGHIQDEAFALCKSTAANRDAKDPTRVRTALLDSFARFGIMPSAVATYIGYPIEQLSQTDLERLRAIGIAIRDGETTWAEVTADVDEEPAKRKAPAPKPTTPPAPTVTRDASPPPTATTAQQEHEKREAQAALDRVMPGVVAAVQQDTGRDPLRDEPPKAKRGTAALKSQLGLGDKAPPPALKLEPTAPSDYEERACSECGVPVECLKSDTGKPRCDACANA